MSTTTNDAAAGSGDAASYEHARDELAAVVGKLESGGLSLDESLVLWERGEHLAAVCTRFLDGARERVEAALERSAAEKSAAEFSAAEKSAADKSAAEKSAAESKW